MVAEGYKQTEVGVIPEDWKVKFIGGISDVIRGASPRPKGDKRYYGGPVPRLMVEDVTRDGKYVIPIVDSLTEQGAKLSRPCKKGTLTIVCSGTVGVTSFLGVDSCIHDGFLGLVNISKTTSKDYIYHQLSSLRESFDNAATHGGVFTNLTTTGVREFPLALPPTLAEQEAIAWALSDADGLIESLEQLIEKKRQIKQGAMQQLLTGKKRLKGFGEASQKYKQTEIGMIPEDWNLKKVNQFAEVKSGKRLPKGNELMVLQTPHPYIRVADMEMGRVSLKDIRYVPENIYPKIAHYRIYKEDIFISVAGTLGIVGVIPRILNGANLTENANRFTNIKISQMFLYYQLCSSRIQNMIDGIKTVGAQPKLALTRIREFLVPLPPTRAEEDSIAQTLSDMDTEITTLETKLSKAKQIKQGMMQELLTGKTRLI